jgi:hypothetical protein
MTRAREAAADKNVVHPVALGAAKPLFAEPMELDLPDTREFASGVLVNTYAHARPAS